jgi:hypothetical protein
MAPLSLSDFTSRKLMIFFQKLRDRPIGVTSIICALLISSSFSASSALTLKRYALSELGERADVIARATVVNARSAWVERRIITTYTLAIRDTYQSKVKAPLSDESEPHHPVKTLALKLLGGSVDGIAQVIPGAPRLQTGEEGVFFLKCIEPESCRLVGYGQGLWRPLPKATEDEAQRWRQAVEGAHFVSTEASTSSEHASASVESARVQLGVTPSASPAHSPPTLTLDQLLKLTIKQ